MKDAGREGRSGAAILMHNKANSQMLLGRWQRLMRIWRASIFSTDCDREDCCAVGESVATMNEVGA